MMNNEESFNQWKEETRREALEKELSRMENRQIRQQKLIQKLRRLLLIVITTLVASWVGFLVFSHNQDNDTATPLNTSSLIKEEKLPDTTKSKNNKPPLTTEKLKIINPTTDTIEFEVPEDGIFFSIQIGAYSGVEMNKFKPNMVSLYQSTSADINQFTLGVLHTYNQALEFKEIARKIGFSDAYITAFQNRKRIPLQEALNLRLQSKGN